MIYDTPAAAFLTLEEIYHAFCQRAAYQFQSGKVNTTFVEKLKDELNQFHTALSTIEYLKQDRIGWQVSQRIQALRTRDPEMGGVKLDIILIEGTTKYGYDRIHGW